MKLEVISREPVSKEHATPLLFVHGLCHGAWCWDKYFLPFFVKNGYQVHAVNLRGHGLSDGRKHLRWNRISQYVEDVLQVARQLPTPPVLIGHSMGGMIVQKVLDKNPVPATILLATVPPSGVMRCFLKLLLRFPLVFAKSIFSLRFTPLIKRTDVVRQMFFSKHTSAAELAEYQKQLQDESFLVFLEMIFYRKPHYSRVKNPILALGADEDSLFPLPDTQATARAYHTSPIQFPNMGHDMMLEPDWEKVAQHMLTWLKEQGI